MKFTQKPDFYYVAELPDAVTEVSIYKLTDDLLIANLSDWTGYNRILDKDTNEGEPITDDRTYYFSPERLYTLMADHFRKAKKITEIEPKGRQLLSIGDVQTYTTPILIGNQPVFISEDIRSGSCLLFIGEQLVNYIAVQEHLQARLNSEAPF